ncbi:MAG: TRAP transporter small permease subunit [Candidatus Methylomirabilales bacterium]|nr:TRAP transporter small permease subunit [candidate division NC10 bacterium]MCZ6549901.1 TRAP transporter small permease subunit [candidate division NC10 bacterium]
MNRIVLVIEKLSMWVGHAFSWCILVLTFAVTYEVFVRYALRDPTAWAFDVSYIMYGALFMMAGAYTLARDGHVRGDVIYRLWPPRVQAAVEFVLYLVFFFPGILALIYAGYDYASESVRWREVSINSPAGVPVYPLKIILVVASSFMLLQGIAEILRCIQCLRTGEWPKRLADVEEMETVIRERKREAEARMAAQQGGEASGETK